MRSFNLKFLLVSIPLFVSFTGAAFSAEKAITTAKSFNEMVADKPLTGGGNTVMVNSDGSLGGEVSGKALTGSWEWSGEYFCRSPIGIPDAPKDQCQKITINGSTVNFISDKGSGRTVSWDIQ